MSYRKLLISMPARYKWVIFLGLASIAAGAVGWWQSEKDLSALDIIYRALSVFGFNDTYRDLPEGEARWALEIARFLGPVSLLLGASAALFDVLGKANISRAAARLKRARDMVVGSSPLAAAATERAQKSGSVFVHLGASLLSKERSLYRLPWEDPGRKEQMLARYSAGAACILVAGETDSETLVLAAAASKASPKSRITAIIHARRLADDYSDLLARSHLGRINPLRILSANDLAARYLHVHNPPFICARHKKQPRIHAVIVGLGDAGEAIARDIAVNCIVLGLEKPRLTVIDPLIEEREAALRQRVPELDATLAFFGIKGGLGSKDLPPGLPEPALEPVTHAYICLGSDSAALSAEGHLRQWLRLSGQPDVPIFVKLRDAALLPEKGRSSGFGSLDEIVELSGWNDRQVDKAPAALHSFYRSGLSEQRKTAHGNDTAQEWALLSPDAQQSNRSAIAHIPAKLFSVQIDQSHWVGAMGIPKLPDVAPLLDNLEPLARLEHDRWAAERRWSGWRFSGTLRTAGGEKSEDLKCHPDLVPFDKLDRESQEHDRAAIRTLSGFLGQNPPAR